MEIPKKIKIGWKEYEVIEKGSNLDLTSGGDECYGTLYPDRRKLYINNSFDEEQKKATLIHEIIHGIDDLFGIGLKEEQVEALGHGIYTVIKDNFQHDGITYEKQYVDGRKEIIYEDER